MDVKVCIIGAGIIGVAIARELSMISDDIVVVERRNKFGQETSSRNSEVIHSGLYYTEGSLKARLCLESNKMIYDYCDEHQIPYQRCGKLIVASKENEIPILEKLYQKGKKNGVKGLKILGGEEIKKMQANITAIQAIYVPSAGILDTHAFMQQLVYEAENRGCNFSYLSDLKAINKKNNGYELTIKDQNGADYVFNSAIVINCAGLEAHRVSMLAGINDPSYKIHYCKGEYFSIKAPKNKKVNMLVYPVPFKNLVGLGVHATVDLSGGLKLGPNAIFMKKNVYDYSVDMDNLEAFYQAGKSYLPFLSKTDLQPEMAGIRPKLQGPGEESRDFLIRSEKEKGHPNFINLLGIDSPGLTSSLAIAKHVATIYKQIIASNE